MTKKGSVWAVGLGPGAEDMLAPKARKAIEEADAIAGYSRYLERMPHGLLKGKKLISSGMTKELERCEAALREAAKGSSVAVVSSGDPGIYGMAGLLLELVSRNPDFSEIRVETIPGVTAASAAAAVLGAPLMNDFAVISLSDLLTPANVILKRLEAAAEADMVCVLYNPRSKSRTDLFDKALEMFKAKRGGDSCFGLVKGASTPEEAKLCGKLSELPVEMVDMSTVVVLGNSQTVILDGKLVTRRGYFDERAEA